MPYLMQIYSEKVVGAIWCPTQTGPAADESGQETVGGAGGGRLTPPYPRGKAG